MATKVLEGLVAVAMERPARVVPEPQILEEEGEEDGFMPTASAVLAAQVW